MAAMDFTNSLSNLSIWASLSRRLKRPNKEFRNIRHLVGFQHLHRKKQQWMDITRRTTIYSIDCGRCCDGVRRKVKALEITRFFPLMSHCRHKQKNESHNEHDGDIQKFFIRYLIRNAVYIEMFAVGGSFFIAAIDSITQMCRGKQQVLWRRMWRRSEEKNK